MVHKNLRQIIYTAILTSLVFPLASFPAAQRGELVFPDTRMMTKHALPNIGDWRGDHFKSSDEANSTYWLRNALSRLVSSHIMMARKTGAEPSPSCA